MKTKTENWYAKTQSSGQGIVADEATGRTVAVVYDGDRDAKLIAAAPELLQALRELFELLPESQTRTWVKARAALGATIHGNNP